MERIDAVVIGAGVVGLAVARALARQGREVVIVEAETAIGTQTSSRNSEVIHAGIYYPPGSLKAQYCVAGKHRLYQWCETAQVPHRRSGKLIVAASADQEPVLETIRTRAAANGVDDLQWLTADQVRQMEPALACTAALWSPSTGIIDSHALMLSLLGDAERHGASLALCSRVVHVDQGADAVRLRVQALDERGLPDGEPFEMACDLLVNSAGHGAVALARASVLDEGLTGGARPGWPQAFHSKGNYFKYMGRAPFTRLVYPVPEPGGLGVHLTLDMGGQARFGPDVEPTERFDYAVDPARAARFYGAIRRYWPGLPDDSLAPDYSGMRPRIRVDGADQVDFRVDSIGTGRGQVIHLFGIESPGLTASLAIADAVLHLAS